MPPLPKRALADGTKTLTRQHSNRIVRPIRKILVYANIIVIIGMMLTGYAGVISPASHPYASLLPFAFPAFMIANMAFLVLWTLVRLRNVWLPLLGFLIAYSPTQTYFPVNITTSRPAGCMKVLSYNILAFHSPDGGPNRIMEYLLHSDADIICMQEYSQVSGQDSLWRLVDSVYHYRDTLMAREEGKPNSDIIGIWSKYPIVRKEILPLQSTYNIVGVFDVDIKGNVVHVINTHLQSVGLSTEDKDAFSAMVHGKTDSIAVNQESKMLMHKIMDSSAIRAPQADVVNNYIRRHHDERIILMGDFNDPPLSYVHRTIASRLTDCYRTAGHGTGYSFHYHSMYFRIDNIMCSDHWKPYECIVDNSIDNSDHYPIYCYLKSEINEE